MANILSQMPWQQADLQVGCLATEADVQVGCLTTEEMYKLVAWQQSHILLGCLAKGSLMPRPLFLLVGSGHETRQKGHWLC